MKKLIIYLLALFMMSSLSFAEPNSKVKNADFKFSSGKYKEALLDYEKIAKSGNASAQLFLSILYSHGVIYSKDIDEGAKKVIPYNEKLALKWLRKAANQNDPLSLYQLGVIYSEGKLGIKKDDKEAFKLYNEAAKQGHMSGAHNVGNMYRQGRAGLKIDYAKAIQYYQAAEKLANRVGINHANALYNIGFLYYQGGYGIKRNPAEAYKYFSKSNQAGKTDAIISMLAICKENPFINVCK